MNRKSTASTASIEKTSGNVYADLGYPDGQSMLIKAQLVAKIAEIIKARSLTQTAAAARLGLTQPKLSAILKGRFRSVSERRLLDCLIGLGHDVRIVISPVPKNRPQGNLTVLFS